MDSVTAMTDVTGFGLLGHLLEMSMGSGLTAEINKCQVPKMEHFDEFANQFIYPENTTRNFAACELKTEGMKDLDFLLFCDPQTNGGLLFSANSARKNEILRLFEEKNEPVWEVGKFNKKAGKSVIFT
jgi:selenide,water dikinase